MREQKNIVLKILAVVLTFTAGVGAQQNGILDRLMGKKEPQVLSGDTKKSTVEVPASALALQDAFANTAAAVKPAVVNISAVQITHEQQNDPNQFYYGDPEEFFRRYFGGGGEEPEQRRAPRERRMEGTGSGVIIDPDGYVLTNNHVVQDATELTVTLSTGKSYRGKVVGTDPRSDLAVVRIKGDAPFAYAPLGDSAKMRIGDWVMAVGSPFGLEQTVTAGIVSAIRQSLTIEGRGFRNLLQTDAAINRGNSGGPLVNLRGEVIGINTAIYAPTGVFSGIGFAIPVNDAKSVLRELIENGFVERSWMGVEIADVDEVIAKEFGLSSKRGALLNKVLPNSPAAKSGLKRGDIILEFDGKSIDTMETLQDTVAATKPGRTVKVKVLRDGTEKTVELKTAVMPKQTADGGEDEEETESAPADNNEKTTEWLGATFSNISGRENGDDQEEDSRVPASGVVAVEIPPSSVAADAGLMEGDVIQSINRRPIKNIADLAKIKKSMDAKNGVVLDVVRHGRSFYLSFKSLQ